MTGSLKSRLLSAASVVLLGFLGLAGAALDSAFTSRYETAVEHRLQGHVFGLLAAAEVDPEGRLKVPDSLPEPRFGRIDSGLYAQISDRGGDLLWQSRSLVNQRLPQTGDAPVTGQSTFMRAELSGGEPVFVYRFGIEWEYAAGRTRPLVVSVAEAVAGYEKEIAAFRRTVWLWLGGSALVLLAVQAFILRWSLRPLTQAAAEVEEVERGARDRLSGGHPREIERLTGNVNALLDNERAQRRRYRNAMDDLAHSIKTPLAVLRAWLDGLPGGVDKVDADRQLDRIRQIVERQLQRAISGGTTFARPVPVSTHLGQVLSALRKVYYDKRVEAVADCAPHVVFFGDEGDLMEVFGNILDNAFKYCDAKVSVACRPVAGDKRPGLEIEVTDDGPGFERGCEDDLVQRGARADRRWAGQGIGLATVRDIADAYGAELLIGRAEPAGGRVVVKFPAV